MTYHNETYKDNKCSEQLAIFGPLPAVTFKNHNN